MEEEALVVTTVDHRMITEIGHIHRHPILKRLVNNRKYQHKQQVRLVEKIHMQLVSTSALEWLGKYQLTSDRWWLSELCCSVVSGTSSTTTSRSRSRRPFQASRYLVTDGTDPDPGYSTLLLTA